MRAGTEGGRSGASGRRSLSDSFHLATNKNRGTTRCREIAGKTKAVQTTIYQDLEISR